ncbi:exopolysaccharide biosynthesis protein [Pararhizobium haloflavum]|uniref:exopolysaccharide biosynthesis protein n=1 Tax=Pararhizobium haloflavum TaxID=2037914 RepID=UPI000C1A6D8F|nr:exopolysaccharide biosynthesis protein [Pararhizobium haloflavum]
MQGQADDDSGSNDEEPPSPRFKRRRGRKVRRLHFSEILADLANDEDRERISVGDLLIAMGDRAFGALMLVFALPNVIPTPPGTSAILGAPLVFLAAQMMFGQRPWLPKVIAARSMTRVDFAALVDRLGPWLARAEKLLKPRLSALTVQPAENVIGLLCLIMAIILVLPIPLGNILPALAISMFAFAILERDGVWVILGTSVFALTLFVVGGVVYALFKAAVFLFNKSFE